MTRAERLANNVTRACDAIQRDLVIEEDGKERTVASVTLQGNLHLPDPRLQELLPRLRGQGAARLPVRELRPQGLAVDVLQLEALIIAVLLGGHFSVDHSDGMQERRLEAAQWTARKILKRCDLQ